MENKDFVRVKNLVVEYSSGGHTVHAVNGVSFSLEKGQNLALVGETGAGKTSIAKSILRILPDPQGKILNGSIVFDGVNLLELSDREMRKVRGKRISMVFQDPMTALNPVKTVGEQIAEVMKKHDLLNKREALDKAKEMLEMVGIPGARHSEYPHQFSGGMKQRVVIAMALACNPMLLIADEPTTALDVTIQAQVLAMMMELKKKLNTAMIMITHDLGIVAQTCDLVAVMYAGEIIEYGTVEQVFTGDKHHPYTVGLFNSIPNLELDERRLHPIDGMMPDPTNLPEGCAFSPRCPHATEHCRQCHPEQYDVNGLRIRCFLYNGEEGQV